MVDPQRLKRFMRPSSLAYVGGRAMGAAARQCRSMGFTGPIYWINPKGESDAGVTGLRNVEQLPPGIDGAFLGVNRQVTQELVPLLAARQVGGVVCYASGFAELGNEGRGDQTSLIASAGDMALLGPNCFGLINCLDAGALWPVAHGAPAVSSGAAVLSQSGNFAYNLSMLPAQFPMAYLISLGNQAQLGVAPLVRELLQNPQVTAIGLHLEGMTQIEEFASVARDALDQGVPIVVLKTGVSAKGAELAKGHTSSLAGTDSVYDALFQRYGVIRVHSVGAFIETLKAATVARRDPAAQLFGLACSGGDAGMIADQAEAANVALVDLAPAMLPELDRILPPFAQRQNPLDFTTAIWGDPAALGSLVDTVLQHSADSDVLLAIDFPTEASGERPQCEMLLRLFADKLGAAQRQGLVCSVFPGLMPEVQRRRLHEAGIPAFDSLELGLQAWSSLARYQRLRSDTAALPARHLALMPDQVATTTGRTLSEWEARERLSAHGLPFAKGRRVPVAQAVQLSNDLRFPLVMKVVSEAIPHKTEVGGVALNLANPQEVARALERMQAQLALHCPEVPFEHVLLEPMAPPPLAELIVAVRREAGFGMSLILGSGGVWVDILRDSVTHLLPTNREAVAAALQSLRLAPLWAGFRGSRPVDLNPVIDAVLALASYAQAHAETLLEVEINPLFVYADGCLAVDALMNLDPLGASA